MHYALFAFRGGEKVERHKADCPNILLPLGVRSFFHLREVEMFPLRFRLRKTPVTTQHSSLTKRLIPHDCIQGDGSSAIWNTHLKIRFYRDLNSDRWIQSPEC